MTTLWRRQVPHTAIWIVVSAFLVGCSSAPVSPAPVETVYRGPTFHNYERSSLSADVYEVQRGDTLYTIAFRANQDLRAIAQLNNLSEPYLIFAGQQLRLRPSAADVNNVHNTSTETKTNVIAEGVAQAAANAYGNTETTAKSDEEQTSGASSAVQSVAPVVTAPAPRVTPNPAPRVAPPTVVQQPPARANNQLRWQWPSSGSLVRRFSNHEVGGKGIEFSGNRGDPIIAAAAGRVVYVGTALRGYGQLIILKHNDDFITAYGHNDSILVREQQWVEAGQQIATMGSSGRDDVRLRFELRFRGSSVNPENYLPRTR